MDLRVTALKRYSTCPKAPGLKPHHGGERESGISVMIARHDDDDDDASNTNNNRVSSIPI